MWRKDGFKYNKHSSQFSWWRFISLIWFSPCFSILIFIRASLNSVVPYLVWGGVPLFIGQAIPFNGEAKPFPPDAVFRFRFLEFILIFLFPTGLFFLFSLLSPVSSLLSTLGTQLGGFRWAVWEPACCTGFSGMLWGGYSGCLLHWGEMVLAWR